MNAMAGLVLILFYWFGIQFCIYYSKTVLKKIIVIKICEDSFFPE